MEPVIIVDYNPEWKVEFENLKRIYEKALSGIDVWVEHIGSTSVPGLCAKSILDIDIVLESIEDMDKVIESLKTIGYMHNGDQGIEGREVFKLENPQLLGYKNTFGHHLYACQKDALSYRSQIILRDHLLSHPKDAIAYGDLKKVLAEKYRANRPKYTEAKTQFITGILSQYSLDGIDKIRAMNKVKG